MIINNKLKLLCISIVKEEKKNLYISKFDKSNSINLKL